MASGKEGHPGAEIKIDGKALEDEVFGHVSRVVVRNRLEGADSFQVEFNAGNEHWEDTDHFPLGGGITISMGQQDDLKDVHAGEITAYFVENRHRKGTKFLFRGMDKSHRLHRATRYRAHKAENDSDAVKAIAGDHNLTAEADDSPYNGEVRMQFGQTDHAFIADRARRLGWVYKVEGDTLRFKGLNYEDSGFSFDIDEDILSYDFGLELEPIPTKVKVRGWNMWEDKPVSYEAKIGDEWWGPVAKKFAPKISKEAFGEHVIQVGELAVSSEDEATEVAKGIFQKRSERALKGPVLIRGNPELKVGTTVYLDGLGPALTGSYLLLEVHHIWTRDGYFTRMLCSRNAIEV